MTDDPVNIHQSVFTICRRLGLNPDDVARLTITPTNVTASIHLRNENGAKYLVLGTRKPASERRRFKVRT